MEGEGRVRRAVGVGDRIERQLAIGDVGRGDQLAGRDVDAVELQRAVGRQRRDLDRGQRVGGRVVDVAEPEVGGGERVAGVLVGRDGAISAGGGVVDGGDRRSEGGRGGEEGRSRGGPYPLKKKREGERGGRRRVRVRDR